MNNKGTFDNAIAITLIVVDPDDITKTKEYHPKSFVDGVYLDKTESENVTDHLINRLDLRHLNTAFRNLLRKSAEEGGIVKLDENGRIPLKYTNPDTIVLYYDYPDVPSLLNNTRIVEDDPYDYGRLLMINDMSGDPRSRGHHKWCIYRYTGGPINNIDSYQVIITESDIDYVIKWEHFDEIFKSSVEQIDAMARNAHKHVNNNAIKGFSEDDNGYLYYKGIKIPFREDFHSIVVTNDPFHGDVLPGDLAFHITGSKPREELPDVKPVEKIITLTGNCDEYYFGEDFELSPKVKMNTVTSAVRMFKSCPRMTYVNWYDLRSLVNADEMFRYCVSLLNLPSFNFESLISAESFAEGCISLVGVGELNAKYLENARAMFKSCNKLKNIDNITLTSLRDATSMFELCKALNYVPDMNIARTESTNAMFKSCSGLKHVGKLVTPRVTNMDGMFYSCLSLTDIAYIDFTSVTSAKDMFFNCISLKYVNIKPQSLTTDLTFNYTNLNEDCIHDIIKGLPVVNELHTLSFIKTPNAEKITADEIDSASYRGWQIVK